MKNRAIIVFLIAVIIIKILILSTTYHHPSWDESVFLGMGKWLYSSQESGLWEQIRPPGLPAVLGIFWWLGLNYITAADLLMLVFTTGVLGLTYLIGRELFDYKTAITASFLTFITPVIFYNSGRILTGIPSLFFCLAAFYLFLRKQYVFSAIFCGVAFIFRFPAALIFVSLLLLLFIERLYNRKPNKLVKNISGNKLLLLKFNLTFIALIILYLIANKLAYGSFIEPLIKASQHQSTFTGNIHGAAYVLFYPVVLIGSNLYFLFAFFAPIKRNLYPLIPFTLFFLYFTIIPHKKERFVILLIPFLSLLAARGIRRVLNARQDKYFYLTICFILFMLFIPVSINNYTRIQNFPGEKPAFVEDYYNYIGKINGTILTSDPVPAAYTNNKYIHFYDGPEKGLKILKNNINNAHAVIYSPPSFPWNSTTAQQRKKEMKALIKEHGTLIANKTIWGQSREIYMIN